jgi:hypothetical protein
LMSFLNVRQSGQFRFLDGIHGSSDYHGPTFRTRRGTTRRPSLEGGAGQIWRTLFSGSLPASGASEENAKNFNLRICRKFVGANP